MKKIVVTMEEKEWKELIVHVYEHKKKDINMPGFRKGQVPMDVYIKNHGVETLFMDAVDHAIPTLYTKLLEDNKDLEIACKPSVDIKEIDEKHLSLEFTITEYPEVKLGEYKNLGLKKETVSANDEEIEHEIEHIRSEYAEYVDKTDSKVEMGDEVTLDFKGMKEGVTFDGGTAENYNLVIGSNSFIPGFEEGLVGLSLNEEKSLELEFPKDYHQEDLKGQKVVFEVKIKNIKQKIMPEFNKEFFDDLNIEGVDSLDKLKEEVKKNIITHKEYDNENKFVEDVLTLVASNAKMDIPNEMIEDEIDNIIEDFSKRLQYQGMNIDTYKKMLNMEEDKFRNMFKDEAKKRVEFRLVIKEIIKKEKIEVSEEETKEYMTTLAKQYSMSEEDFLKQVGNPEYLKYDLLNKKALDLITK